MQNQIPNNWQKVKLGNISKIITGKTPPTSQKYFFGNEFPFITPTDIKDFNIRYNYQTDRFVSKKWANKAKNLLVPKDSTCFVCIGSTIGKLCLVKTESFTNQQINSVIADQSKANPIYIYYWLMNNQKNILKEFGGGGAAKPIINKSTFGNIELSLPNDLNEQQKIASILSSFDDKIELNNKISKTLEEMASAIFKEWFMKSVKSEKLKVKNLKIRDIAFVKTGNRPGKLNQKKENNFTVPVYGAKEIMGYTNKALYNQKIIITGRVGTIGEVNIINKLSWPSDNALILIPKNYNYFYFIYFLAKRINYLSLNRGSSQPLIAQSDIENYLINLPDKNLVIKFNSIASKLFLLKENKEKENQKLEVMRDLLLPKLMKGEIRV